MAAEYFGQLLASPHNGSIGWRGHRGVVGYFGQLCRQLIVAALSVPQENNHPIIFMSVCLYVCIQQMVYHLSIQQAGTRYLPTLQILPSPISAVLMSDCPASTMPRFKIYARPQDCQRIAKELIKIIEQSLGLTYTKCCPEHLQVVVASALQCYFSAADAYYCKDFINFYDLAALLEPSTPHPKVEEEQPQRFEMAMPSMNVQKRSFLD